jgi:hypothetical protein
MMIWGPQTLLLNTNGIKFQKIMGFHPPKKNFLHERQGKGQHLEPKKIIFLLCSQIPKNLTCPNVVFIL